MGFTVSVEHDGATTRLVLDGELDMATEANYGDVLRGVFTDEAMNELVLDAFGLRFMDSSGIRVCRKGS